MHSDGWSSKFRQSNILFKVMQLYFDLFVYAIRMNSVFVINLHILLSI